MSAALCFCLAAAARKPKTPAVVDGNRDAIRVIAHIALNDSSPCQMTTAEHWRKQYLYLDHPQTSNLTVVDITNAAQPHVAKEIHHGEIVGDVRVMVGDIGLITSPASESTPKTVSIISFADPQTPKLQQTFKNVSGFSQAPRRSLIFIVNDEGLWILREQPALDLDLQKEYDRHVLYDR